MNDTQYLLDEIDYLQDQLTESRIESEKFHQAIQDIFEHVKLMGGQIAEFGIIYQMCKKALNK